LGVVSFSSVEPCPLFICQKKPRWWRLGLSFLHSIVERNYVIDLPYIYLIYLYCISFSPFPILNHWLNNSRCCYAGHPLICIAPPLFYQGIYDKGKGALMREETRFTNVQGRLIAVSISGSFLRGVTGFQSKGPELPARITAPSRAPDAVVEETTLPEQALIYRLSGDYNSLHADPEIAQTVGFDKPILHGLCTFGHSARAVLQSGLVPDNNPALLRSVTARFSKPAYPGETLVTSCWKMEGEGGGRIVFQTTVKERGVVVLEGGLAEVGEAGAAGSTYSKL